MNDYDELKKYQYDVEYEVWRHGGSMDDIEHYEVDECFYQRVSVDDCADIELNKQKDGKP